MLTIEKFYFNHAETDGNVTAGCDARGYYLAFLADDDSPINIQITVQRREDFAKLIADIYEITSDLLAADRSRGEASPAPNQEPSIPANTDSLPESSR